jgi:subtilase family serine protease
VKRCLVALSVLGLAVLCAAGAFSRTADRTTDLSSSQGLACRIDPVLAVQAIDSRPDLVVSLRATPLVSPHQDVTITVAVKNIGGGPAPESDFEIIIRNGHATRQVVRTYKRKIRALEPGESFSFSFAVKLSLGLYQVCGTADRKKKIQDPDRANNKFCLMIEGI